MGETEAQDTMDVSGLYLVPIADALDAQGGLAVGAPALFLLTEDPAGLRVTLRFEGGPPSAPSPEGRFGIYSVYHTFWHRTAKGVIFRQ